MVRDPGRDPGPFPRFSMNFPAPESAFLSAVSLGSGFTVRIFPNVCKISEGTLFFRRQTPAHPAQAGRVRLKLVALFRVFCYPFFPHLAFYRTCWRAFVDLGRKDTMESFGCNQPGASCDQLRAPPINGRDAAGLVHSCSHTPLMRMRDLRSATRAALL